MGVLLLGAGLVLALVHRQVGQAPPPVAEKAPPLSVGHFVPVARLGDGAEVYTESATEAAFREGPEYGEVEGRVVDKRGRPVARGFVSFDLPHGGRCGNERSHRGRVPIIDGRFRLTPSTNAQELRVVAEDGRSARVTVTSEPLVPGTVRPRKPLEVVLPELPGLAGVSGDVLPWAPSTPLPYRLMLITLKGTEGASVPLAPTVLPALLAALERQGLSVQRVELKASRQGLVQACEHDGACLRSVLPELNAEGVLLLSAPSAGELDYTLVPFSPRATRRDGLSGHVALQEPLGAGMKETARELARGVLSHGKWTASRSGAPRDACEYVYGARFETTRRDGPGFGVITFTSRLVREPGVQGDVPGLEWNPGTVKCEGWNLFFHDEEAGNLRPTLHASVDPATGRLRLGDTEFLWAGALESDEW